MPDNVADPLRSMDDLAVRSADAFRKDQGIDLRTGHRAVRINPKEGSIDSIAADAGIELGHNGSIVVDPQLQTSAPAVYAGGDCADAFHVVSGQRVWIPLALRANRAGWAVADHISGKPVHLQGVAGRPCSNAIWPMRRRSEVYGIPY